MQQIAGSFINHEHRKIAIVCSRFNDFIVNKLEAGALDVLKRHGIAEQNISVFYVPGALEIPVVVKLIAEKRKFDAIIALGAIIQGATAHFDIVINESAKGLSQIALSSGIPVLNGILTTNTIEQAIERAGTKAGNKGAEVAMAALEMISLIEQI